MAASPAFPKIENTVSIWYTPGETFRGVNKMQKLYQKNELGFALLWIALAYAVYLLKKVPE